MQAIELVTLCNNVCSFCAQSAGHVAAEVDEVAESSSLLARHSIDRQLDAGTQRVAFVGGEPTLSPHLEYALGAARARGRQVLLQTNARLLAQATVLAALRAAGLAELDVSLHGIDDEMHDYHTGVAGSFQETVSGVRRAQAAGVAVGLTQVVTRSNFRHLVQMVSLARTLGARAVHFAPLVSAGRAARDKRSMGLIPAPEMVRPHLHRALRSAASCGIEVVYGDHSTSAAARDWFAGIGRQAPAMHVATPARSGDALTNPRRLPLVSGAVPGRGQAASNGSPGATTASSEGLAF